MLPKEKLTFFRLNARVSKEYADCKYCNKVRTKGRDGLGFGQCDDCLTYISNQIESKQPVDWDSLKIKP